MKRIVSITPLAVRSDSRTDRIAASFARFGYESVVVEGGHSGNLDTPYRRVSLGRPGDGTGHADTTRDLRKKLVALEALCPLPKLLWWLELPLMAVYLIQFIIRYVICPWSRLPRSSVYYLHSYQYYMLVFLKSFVKNVQIIYDFHDYYRMMTDSVDTTRFEQTHVDSFISAIERHIARHAIATVTVSNGVADLFMSTYGVAPIVIRNLHDRRTDRPSRIGLRESIGLSCEDFLMVAVGNDKAGSANATLIRAMQRINAHLAFLGRGFEHYRSLIDQYGLSQRVHLIDPVPNQELVDFIRNADVAIIPYVEYTPNYRYCLPNKLFEAISAGLPILYPNLPEIRNIVTSPPMGIQFDPSDEGSFVDSVRQLMSDRSQRDMMRENALHSSLDWEAEETKLAGLLPDARPADILVIYFQESPLRSTVRDHLFSFREFSGHRVFYHNARLGLVPPWLDRIQPDLIVFHTVLLARRWDRPAFEALVRQAGRFADHPAVKIALPQDEFINLDLLNRFLSESRTDLVFSVAPPPEWPKIYPGIDPSRIREVLTGYLDDALLNRLKAIRRPLGDRPVDIGYRARKVEAWQGRFGLLKGEIADAFLQHRNDLKMDISTDPADTILGDDWYRFLASCKYTIGVEGGAGIIDWDGSIRSRTRSYTATHPEATFNEIEAACFPGMDDSLRLYALSPRHLEACATRTAQILIEGRYNGILQPGVHYIELRRDFSNLEDVLAAIHDDRLRETLVDNAWRDVVESGRYTYRGFVETVLNEALPPLRPRPHRVSDRFWHGVSRLVDDAVRLAIGGYHHINVKLGLYPHDSLFHYLKTRLTRTR